MNKFFLDLGKQPLANDYLSKYKKKQIKYNLRLYFNSKTKLVSISKRIPSQIMFNSKYPYRSSLSTTMKKSFKKLSAEISKKFNPKLILEIGSNDGALITNFKKNQAIGVEPCKNLANITKKKGYITYDEYWDYNLAEKINKRFKSVDLVYSANTLTHISDLKKVFKSISSVLSESGILIIEDPSLLECLKKNTYDQFYNEHIYLFSTISVQNVLKNFDFEIFDLKNLNTHGGSIRYYIKRISNHKIKINKNVITQINKEKKFGLDKISTYKKFSIRVDKSKKKLIKILNNLKDKGNKIAGYGATAKSVTIMNYCNISSNLIDTFFDTTPEKINKFLPGKEIKILKYNKDKLAKFNYAFLGAWNFKEEIFNKEKSNIKKGLKFITHVPYPRII